ncbi:MAG TPA: hypothetical protein VG916_00385 [Gemmatimonadaceae bacterium]|nr:hypothetical protein [Gemmatimonadaceae bacterium]
MVRTALAASLTLALAACGGGADTGNAAEAGSAKSAPPARRSATVAASTTIKVTMRDSLNSRVDKPDQHVRATVASDVSDASGRVAIPAGSPVTLAIVKLEPGSDQVRPEGRLELATISVTVDGKTIPLHATIGPIPHHMKGRGLTKDEAGRVAAGTAVGALIGQAIGKNTRSTVVGGAVGAVAGGAVAVRYAYRDVIVDPGATFTLTLTQPVVVSN